MCAEAVPWRCHRSLIADALLVRGIRTEDIMSPTRCQIHTLTPFAKVRGTTITYPARDLTETIQRNHRPNARDRVLLKQSNPRPIDRLQNIEKCEDLVCGHQSASRFLSSRRPFFQQQDVLVSAESGRVTSGSRRGSEKRPITQGESMIRNSCRNTG